MEMMIEAPKTLYALLDIFSRLNDTERGAIFEALKINYCMACGGPAKMNGRSCQCDNDE